MPVRAIARVASALALAAVGGLHFITPRPFVAHVPPPLPAPLAIVYATGVAEVALALALLAAPARLRPLAGTVAAGYLLAVFPGNVYVAAAGLPVYPEPWQAWARLPLQPVFIALVLWSTRR